jgi:tetratricopeptide (TPR) repeat protein
MKVKGCILGLTIIASCCNSPSRKNNDKKVITDEDTGTAAIARMANSSYRNDDYPDAVKYFSVLIARDTTNGEYYFRRGYSYARLIKKRDAIEDYKRAIKYHFKVASANFNIGLNFSYDNDSLALYYFNKCIEADPAYADAYVQIQDCERRMKERERK